MRNKNGLYQLFTTIKVFVTSNQSKKQFRKKNEHNNLTLKSYIPIDYIEAGKASYGPLNISYGSPKEYHLKIGSYVSISPNVLFLLANEHNTNTITTFPLRIKYLEWAQKQNQREIS